jgi:transcriptional regulator with XRE-family HTH domain
MSEEEKEHPISRTEAGNTDDQTTDSPETIAAADLAPQEPHSDLTIRLISAPFDIAEGMALGAARIVSAAAGASMRVGRTMLRPERLELMAETGNYLRDMREVAGLTLMELSEALDLEDKTLLEAVENGTATLSFELILRMAALVSRHDPIPFVMRMTRTYNPGVWQILHDWGIGRVTLQFEREREFLNLLRPHDGARKLSDKGFAKVLDVTRAAFEMALYYALAEEGIQDRPTAAEPSSTPESNQE